MLAALWRESPVPRLADRPAAGHHGLAAPHRPRRALPGRRADRASPAWRPAEWLRRYLEAYLTPLLHCLYAYDLAFMPHGENVILVARRTAWSQRVIFKDIAEEIVVMDPDGGPAGGGGADPGRRPRRREGALRSSPTSSTASSASSAAILVADGVLTEDDVLAHRRRLRRGLPGRAPHLADRFAAVRPLRRRVRALLPQPAAAAQQPADGGPGRPVGRAAVRR